MARIGYLVTHRHLETRCPAGDPAKGPMLLRRLSPEGAERFGITIQAEAMIDGAHPLTMIVDSPDHDKVTEFVVPLCPGRQGFRTTGQQMRNSG